MKNQHKIALASFAPMNPNFSLPQETNQSILPLPIKFFRKIRRALCKGAR
jgi:CRISPR/Cas system CMR-associated protein Cmr3 (group 5 of RAMP superfamily)